MKMSGRRGKSPGWAAFDLKLPQNEGSKREVDEPYPPMSGAITPLRPSHNFMQDNKVSRSFTSVLSADDVDHRKPLLSGNSSTTQRNKFTSEPDIVVAYAKIRELHSWADESLIEDIMAAVNNDVDKASTVLMGMVPNENPEQNKDSNIRGSKSKHEHFPLDHTKSPVDEGASSGELTDFGELTCVIGDCFNSKTEELTNDHASCGNEDSDIAAANVKLILGQLNSIPVEPEWEEDDIYLIHRKDAIRMTRLASQHARAAMDAYLRRDHFSAQQLSMKVREERMAAERLNAKAANAIFNIRNGQNSLWELDLHGLHAVEAVQALQERLQKLESLVPSGRSVSPNRKSEGATMVSSASVESLSCMERSKLDEQRASSQQRPISLQVITGRGNHSRGQAALPTAVRNFLNENGYRYDEARPGLITVRPKFRRLRVANPDCGVLNVKMHFNSRVPKCFSLLRSFKVSCGLEIRYSNPFSCRPMKISSVCGNSSLREEKWRCESQAEDIMSVLKSQFVKVAAVMACIFLVIPAADAVDALKTCSCLLKECRLELAKCIANPSCAANVACLQTCNNRPDETECQIRCGDLFENNVVDEFNECAVSRKKCVPRKSDVGEFPVPDPNTTVGNFNIKDFSGTWFITSGLNPTFDTFGCQRHEFHVESDRLVGNLSWRIPTPDGGFINRSAIQRFVQDPSHPGILYNHDNEYLHYQDDWYILSSRIENKEDDYIFVYYRGRNDAWDGYGGAVVYTRSAVLPKSIVPELQKAAKNVGRDFNKFITTDNTCGPEPPLVERLEKTVEEGERTILREVEEIEGEVEKVGKTEMNLLGRLVDGFNELKRDEEYLLKELSKEEMDLLNELKMETNEIEKLFGGALPLRKIR
ncbi:hypothetical protein RHMOL_Rhmol10G0206700 [Rhododendron molle]|uniref:Uncharacterized protein n=1 Tax=Rhododendron molle TaxID=49168 RepID=A0ACC0M4J3_RHOML|nr:hypothetical protein RHMOL_Rhmol10G0206700 [Rhododendron molle]